MARSSRWLLIRCVAWSVACWSSTLGAQSGVDSVPGEEHVVDQGGQKLFLWERCLADVAERATETGRVVLFLHGGTWSGRPAFDLQVRDCSTLEYFARHGWDAFALDVRGYGKSDDPPGESWSDTEDAVRDVVAAVDHIRGLRSVDRVHLVGWSWGSQVAGRFAEIHPERVARLVEYGSRWQPFAAPPKTPDERFRTNTEEAAMSDFVEGCFEQDVAAAFVAAALKADPVSPNGCLRDYFEKLPLQDPRKIDVPTMIVLGEHEAEVKQRDQFAFFARLPNPDKRFVVLPGGGHGIHLEVGRHRWRRAVLEFLAGERD